ncbi:hypothetical protein OOK60_15820 [Trichothermofontia sichuanensis B231]|uniref:hypothetical protein n=1 Tax=Trichothermofontia sichuanensis TaxID=3045816 RepID=UPI002247A9FE|nr:hypothetical protein [Trichothermofontia sichuanensis]UZQ53939.1 hypothetical protein OOK60_15820 [Trichothermofontia sichuanensis B231]
MSKKTVAQMVEQQQHYLLALKPKQPTLYRSLQQMPEQGDGLSQAEPVDTSYQRQVHRQVTVYAAPAAWRRHWPGLKHRMRVERWGQRGGQAFSESMGYITNREGSAEPFWAHIQEHWGIENR